MGTAGLLRAGRCRGPSRGRRLDYSHRTEQHRATGGEGGDQGFREPGSQPLPTAGAPGTQGESHRERSRTWEADGSPQALGHRQTPMQQGRTEQSRLTNANHSSFPSRSPDREQKPRLRRRQRGGQSRQQRRGPLAHKIKKKRHLGAAPTPRERSLKSPPDRTTCFTSWKEVNREGRWGTTWSPRGGRNDQTEGTLCTTRARPRDET